MKDEFGLHSQNGIFYKQTALVPCKSSKFFLSSFHGHIFCTNHFSLIFMHKNTILNWVNNQA